MCVVVSAEKLVFGCVLLVLVNVLGIYPALWVVRVKIPPYLTLISAIDLLNASCTNDL